ncbi:MAG: HvfB family MNIO-type RiPP peptide maturase [Methylococcales bacterium]
MSSIIGAGLGLRRAFIDSLTSDPPSDVDFYEIAPENWLRAGGRLGKKLRSLTERFPFVCHGLSLSLGSPSPLDESFILDIKEFLRLHRIRIYTEHLSYCSDDGHLYDLMPIPFTLEAAEYAAARIRRVQELLEQRIAIENVSYYAAPGKEIEEIEFLNAVLDRADCGLLLDINNIYVNRVNHGYDPHAFLAAIPAERIAYAHIAGHYVQAQDLIVDTHGAQVISPVWDLLETAYQLFGVFPTLLERDFNIPPLPELIDEVKKIRSLQVNASGIVYRNEA